MGSAVRLSTSEGRAADRLGYVAELLADEAKLMIESGREVSAVEVFRLAGECAELADHVRGLGDADER